MKHEFESKLGPVKDKVFKTEQVGDKRIYLHCEAKDAFALNRYFYEELKMRFVTITGIDAESCFELLYHYSNDAEGSVFTIKAFIRDRQTPSIESIAQFLPAAMWIEREIHELFGINFLNHPNQEKLISEGNWAEGVYPLRKEFK